MDQRGIGMDQQRHWDVIVVGAGITGLAAGRLLAEAGLTVAILEARDRIGGRILTVRERGEIIEMGAEFVHGRPPELLALLAEAGLEIYERTGDLLQLENGVLRTGAKKDTAPASQDSPLERLKEYAGPQSTTADISFAAYLDEIGVDGSERFEAIAFVEGFNAADAGEASIRALGYQQQAEDAIDGDRNWRLQEGYDRLPHFVAERFQAAGGRIVLNAPVEAVDWQPGRVIIRTASGEFTANRAVITLPLGVLQAETVRFDPAPGSILEIASMLRMGQVCRLTLVFSRSLWPEEMSFLLTRELLPSVWWTAYPAASRSLTGWVGGPRASALLVLDSADLYKKACSALAWALTMAVEDVQALLVSAHTHNWQSDPYSLGAYSWIPAGAVGAPVRMTEPVASTLFFAGEHTDTTGHWGTVHAALGSGLRAARQVLEERTAV